MKKIYLLLMMAFVVNAGWAQTTTRFNDGYLTIYKLTSGAALNNAGTAIVAEEYLPTGAAQASPNFSVALPTTNPGRVVTTGTGTSVGAISRSENGGYLTIPGYDLAVGTVNASLVPPNTIRTINGTGTVGVGITGTFHSTAASYRGAVTDDGANFWTSGNGTPAGTNYSNNGTTVVTVSTTSTNTRVVKIFNGQLYYSTGSAPIGIYKVGSNKPTTAGTNTSVQLFTLNAANASPYGFSISPDGNTVYIADDGASKGIFRYTFSGTWSGGTQIFTGSGYAGVAVDWTGYTFSAAAANGAKIYACNSTTLLTGADNGTSAITTTTLRTITGNNAFRQLDFSPIKQTVSLGANSPAAATISQSATDVPLFQLNLAANEGNSTVKKIVVGQIGTATIGSGNDISNFRLIDDANGNGVYDGGETVLSTATVSGTSITFSSISLASYITEGTSKNFLVVGDVSATATGGNTFKAGIPADKFLNSVNYTSYVVNASGSFVNYGATAPIGNTQTISSVATPTITLSPTTLTGFKYVAGAGPSAVQSFSVAASNLSPAAGNIVVTAPADYEINDGSGWVSTSFNIAYTGGTLSATNVDVRLKAGLAAGFYNTETISVAGGGDSKNETVSGKVVATEPTIQSAITFGAITNTTMVVNFSGGNGAKRILLVKALLPVSSDPVDETTYNASATYAAGDQIGTGNYVVYAGTGNTVTVTGLSIGTLYQYAVYEYNDNNIAGVENYLVPAGVNSATTTSIPIVYTWIGGSSTWNTPANWLPVRTFPSANDILLFLDGTTETVTAVPNESIGQLHVTLGTHVTLQAATATTTLTLNGSILLDDLTVDATSALNISGANGYTINLATGTTAAIDGAMTFTGGIHKLTAADASGVTFTTGAVFTAGAGFSGNAFGAGTANSVIFANGSRYDFIAGSNPFALGQPASIVVFQTGSLFRVLTNLVAAFSGRTYANFEVDNAAYSTPSTGAAPLSIDNLTITNGALNLNLTGGISIKGNISVASGQTLTFTPASANTLTFNGTSAQSISNAGTLTFAANTNVTMNNAAGLTLNAPVTFRGLTTFTSGLINTTTPNLLTLAATSSVTGASNSSFVNGPVSKIGNTAFIFPVGKTNCGPGANVNGYAAIDIGNFTGGAATDEYVAEYIRGNTFVNAPKAVGLDHVSKCDYWTLNRTSGASTVDITLHWNDPVNNCTNASAYVNNLPSLTVAHYDGSTWNSFGVIGIYSGTTTTGTVTWSLPQSTAFGVFTIGSVDFANPLPITINYFTGAKNNGNHLLNWKITCVTVPSATIEMERSTDGRNYSSIYSIFATALRCQQPFDYTDAQPAKGVNYYRLKMTDADGKITYSTVVSLLNADKGIDVMNIAPNPVVNSSFNLQISSADKTQLQLVITDMQGRVVQKESVNLVAGFNTIPMNVKNLAAGTYQLFGYAADEKTRVLRFVIQ